MTSPSSASRSSASGWTRRAIPSIRAGHGCVFRFIHQGGCRLTDLAASSGLTKQAVGEVVDDLERLGYVERRADPADRRAKVISLTETGADAQQTALGIFSDIEQRLGERYGKKRIEAMRSLLEEISARPDRGRPRRRRLGLRVLAELLAHHAADLADRGALLQRGAHRLEQVGVAATGLRGAPRAARPPPPGRGPP